jgi:hypothetical protein
MASFCMHGMGLCVVAALENDGMQEKWELKKNEMRRQRRRWWA